MPGGPGRGAAAPAPKVDTLTPLRSLGAIAAACVTTGLWRQLEPTAAQAAVTGLAAAGDAAAAGLVASVAGMPSPGAKAAAVLRHLPQLAYLLLWRQWVGVELLTALTVLAGLAVCRAPRMQGWRQYAVALTCYAIVQLLLSVVYMACTGVPADAGGGSCVRASMLQCPHPANVGPIAQVLLDLVQSPAMVPAVYTACLMLPPWWQVAAGVTTWLNPTALAVMAVRYGPGVFDPAGSVALTAPGPFSWASLAAVLAQRRMQRLLLAWAVRSLPVMLLSAAQLLRQRQVARRAAVAAAAAAAIAQRPAGKGQQQASSSSVPAVSPLPAAAAKDAGTQRAAEPATRSGPSGAASSSLPAAPSYKLESLQPRAVALKPDAAVRMRYSRYLRAVHATLKLQLPHAQYAQLAVQLPVLIQQAAWPPPVAGQQAAAGGGAAAPATAQGAPSGGLGWAGSTPLAAGTVDGAPCMLRYTHAPGCLTAILEYAAQQGARPASQLAADLQLVLPSSAQLMHLSIQERGCGHGSSTATTSTATTSTATTSTATTSTSFGCAPSAQGVWADPVVLRSGDASCTIDAVLPAPVLQQLLGGEGQQAQLRVLVTAAAGELMSDSVLDATLDQPGGGGGKLQVKVPLQAGPLLLVHLLTAGPAGTADQHVASLPLLVLPDKCACDEVAHLWAGMVSNELERQAAAAAAQGSPGAGSSSSTGSPAQEAAAASAAYAMLSDFASEFGELMAGVAAAPGLRAHMLAYLAANSMHACQRLLASSGMGCMGMAPTLTTSQAAPPDATQEPPSLLAPPAATMMLAQHRCRPRTSPARSQQPRRSCSLSLPLLPAAPGSHLCMRDLLGFSDAREEAAFQLSRAQRLAVGDAWTLAATAMTALMALMTSQEHVRASTDERAGAFLVCTCIFWVCTLMPGAVYVGRRPAYVAHRGWLWAAGQILAGCQAGLIVALLGDTSQDMMRAVHPRAWVLVGMEFVGRPALLRLSPRQQAAAAAGSALTTWASLRGTAHGTFSGGVLLAFCAVSVLVAAALEASARLSWRAAHRPLQANARRAAPADKCG